MPKKAHQRQQEHQYLVVPKLYRSAQEAEGTGLVGRTLKVSTHEPLPRRGGAPFAFPGLGNAQQDGTAVGIVLSGMGGSRSAQDTHEARTHSRMLAPARSKHCCCCNLLPKCFLLLMGVSCCGHGSIVHSQYGATVPKPLCPSQQRAAGHALSFLVTPPHSGEGLWVFFLFTSLLSVCPTYF